MGEPDAGRAFWQAYAEGFAYPIGADNLLAKFTSNTAVTGSYAETWVRSVTRSMVGAKFRVSTGAVVAAGDASRGLKSTPQCDLIVWDPSELPGLFEAAEFALVPRASVRAVLEVKRSISKTATLEAQLEQIAKRVPERRVLGVVVRHRARLFRGACKPNWFEDYPPPAITRLLDTKGQPDRDGIMTLVYFLAQVAGHDRTVTS